MIFTLQWVSFLWARLIWVLPAYWANDWPTRSIFSELVLKYSHTSRERMDRTATGICYSHGIPQVLLKVTIKFKNANLFLNVILNWTLSSNNTCPALFSWNRLRYKIQQRSKLLSSSSTWIAYDIACVASVPELRARNSGRAKNGARAKRWKERGGGGEWRERLPANPSILKNRFVHERGSWLVRHGCFDWHVYQVRLNDSRNNSEVTCTMAVFILKTHYPSGRT